MLFAFAKLCCKPIYLMQNNYFSSSSLLDANLLWYQPMCARQVNYLFAEDEFVVKVEISFHLSKIASLFSPIQCHESS